MKVSELIEKLKTMPQDKEVLIAGYTSYENPIKVGRDLVDGYQVVVIATDPEHEFCGYN